MQDTDRPRSAVIADTNNNWPPATPVRPGRKRPSPYLPPPQVSMRPPPTSSFHRLGVSSSYLDSTPDDAILDEGDQAMDSDPDAWVSEDEPPPPLSSRRGGSLPFMGGLLRTSEFYSPSSSPDSAVGRSASATLSAVNNRIGYLLEAFEDRVLCFEPNDPLVEDLIDHIDNMYVGHSLKSWLAGTQPRP